MRNINNIAVHHAGGIANDPYASSLHLTVEQISRYHRQRWNDYNPSMYIFDESVRWAGYNVIYDPKDRTFTQCRAIGEETMAQYGHNFDTFSLCIIGNYMINPATGQSVDPMTPEIEDNVSRFLTKLIEKDYSRVVVVPGTILNFAIARTNPHRVYQQTDCYGTALSNRWIQDLLTEKKYPAIDAGLSVKIALLKRIVELYLQLQRLKTKLGGVIVSPPIFGSHGDHACTGFIHLK